jgi:hypothetical protein
MTVPRNDGDAMTNPPETPDEVARYIEVVLLPAYSEANELFDGPMVSRAVARHDLLSIAAMLRDLKPAK